MPEHHAAKVERAPGVWGVARPERDSSWVHQWLAERTCRVTTGHCWHPMGMIDWWCCMCSAETDGMPPQRCVRCQQTEKEKPHA